jgi:hypothetical protein
LDRCCLFCITKLGNFLCTHHEGILGGMECNCTHF